MCFSASASFSAAALLTALGIYSVSQPIKIRFLPLAAVPLLFGIQQLSEGFAWIFLGGNYAPLALQISMYAFLFFALLFWPLWIPIAVYCTEQKNKNKKYIGLTFFAGSLTASYLLRHIIIHPVTTTIWCGQMHCSHILYDLNLSDNAALILNILYLTATIGPLCFSTMRGSKVLAGAFTLSYLITFFFYRAFILSVWCFFSALLSILIMYYIKKGSSIRE